MRGIAWDRAKAALETAAAQTRKRIENDRRRASRQVKPLLTALSRELFNPDLTARGLLRSCKVGDHNVATLFRQDVGEPPARYVRLRRLETAAYLLANSEVRISDVALLVGYLELTSFSRSFRDWIGLSPTAYRRKERESSALPPTPRVLPHPQDWDCAERGALDDATVQRFLQRLSALYPRLQLGPNTPNPVKIIIDGTRMGRMLAGEIWEQLAGLPHADQHTAIRHQFAFTTPALFKLLSKHSREEGRKDSARGVVLAELALASIEASTEVLGDDAANYRAEAWARIGNARRLAADYPGAAKAFALAWGVWQQPRSLYRPEIEAEIANLDSSLRMNQRNFDHAAELASTAVRLGRSAGDSPSLARYLIQLGCVLFYDDDAPSALLSWEEARDLTKDTRDQFLSYSANHCYCVALITVKRFREAKVALAETMALSGPYGYPTYRHQLQWLQGLLNSGQGRLDQTREHLLSARQGFIRSGDLNCAAAISLDLAVVFHQSERLAEMVNLLSESLPVFEALQVDREYLAALGLLRRALGKRVVSKQLIDRVRELVPTAMLMSLTNG